MYPSLFVAAFVVAASPLAAEASAAPPPQSFRTVTLVPSQVGLPSGLSFDAFREVLIQAAQQWSYPAVPCGVSLVVGAPSSWWSASQDGVNLVSFRSQVWCHNNRCGHTSTFPLQAMGMTTVYPDGAAGRDVQEADVEVNGVFFALVANVTPQKNATGSKGAKRRASLHVALLHELGHLLGLPDACGHARTGNGRPLTDDCRPSDRQRIMFPFPSIPALSSDDVAALCAIYPLARR